MTQQAFATECACSGCGGSGQGVTTVRKVQLGPGKLPVERSSLALPAGWGSRAIRLREHHYCPSCRDLLAAGKSVITDGGALAAKELGDAR
jgi:hypothetical protein